MTIFRPSAPIKRIPDDDPIYNEACVLVWTRPLAPTPPTKSVEPDKDYETLKREALDRGRKQLQNLPPHSGRMIDLTGTRPIPKFRPRGIDEGYQEYLVAYHRASQSWCRADILRRDMERHQGTLAEVVLVPGSDGVWMLDWVKVIQANPNPSEAVHECRG